MDGTAPAPLYRGPLPYVDRRTPAKQAQEIGRQIMLRNYPAVRWGCTGWEPGEAGEP